MTTSTRFSASAAHPPYQATLVSVPTDTTSLDGLYAEPEGGATAGAVLFFHGNTMNFYVGASRFLPPALLELGFACFAFNRRGHDILSVRDDKEHPEGAAFQTTAQAIEDHAIAAAWLADQGHPNPIVVGHSNGGMMAVPHVLERPETPALILLSAGAGGPARSQRSGLLAGDRIVEITQQAQELVDSGRGDTLMSVPGWWYVITAESFLDRLRTVPDILDLAPRITCPTLFIRGGAEPVATYPAERFAELAGGPCESVIVPGADHFYRGHEKEITDVVSGFLRRSIVGKAMS
jgi:pimeloyl-ACP methyl ester carboxylesterase